MTNLNEKLTKPHMFHAFLQNQRIILMTLRKKGTHRNHCASLLCGMTCVSVDGVCSPTREAPLLRRFTANVIETGEGLMRSEWVEGGTLLSWGCTAEKAQQWRARSP